MMNLIYFVLIGLAAGWLAGKLIMKRNFNVGQCLIVGVIGAILGGFLFQLVGLAATSFLGDLIAATAGAIVLLFLLQKIKT
jgi:uncharacterized membrane protein YeaQ/YmgE (transglycosylase-associated protein family)